MTSNTSKASKRTDVHRPGAIVPADYRELFQYAHATTIGGWRVPGFNVSLLAAQRLGRPFAAASDESYPSVARPFADDSGKPYPVAAIHKGGNCDSCGAWHVYGSMFLHVPTKEVIAVGWQCAGTLGMSLDAAAIARLKKSRAGARESVHTRIRRRRNLRTFVADNRSDEGRELRRALRCGHGIVRDIRAKLIYWAGKHSAGLTQRQAALVLKLARQEAEKAAAPAENLVPAPIDPNGKRQTVRGRVVSVKLHEGAYGDSYKMTVKCDDGAGGTWFAWGTRPSALGEGLELGDAGLRGCVVEFDAKLERSDRDEHFAFAKRPTRACVVELGPEQVAHAAKIRADAEESAATPDDETPERAASRRNWVAARLALAERMESLFPRS